MKIFVFGYTLIELIVVITIIMVLTSGGIVYFNDFNSKQKIESARSEIVANLQMTRNYAITKQTPLGFTDPIQFISFDVDSKGVMTATAIADDVGTTYFSRQLTADGVTIDISPNDIKFAPFDGKLLMEDPDVPKKYIPRPVAEVITITVSTPDLNNKTIEIKSSGLIDEK